MNSGLNWGALDAAMMKKESKERIFRINNVYNVIFSWVDKF